MRHPLFLALLLLLPSLLAGQTVCDTNTIRISPNELVPVDVNPVVLNEKEMNKALNHNFKKLRNKVEGKRLVVLRVYVDSLGIPKCHLVAKSDWDKLTEVAEQTYPIIRFSPAMVNGRKTPVWVSIPFRYSSN